MNWLTIVLLPLLASPWTWMSFTFGALIGSFLNVCIIRIPAGTFWRHARSVCPHCESLIPWYFNIPILSFILLRGRAACCKQSIAWQYPLVEMFTAVIFTVLYWKDPFIAGSWGSATVTPDHLIRFGHKALLASYLIVVALIDLRHMYIPDVLSIPMLVLLPLAVFIHPDLSWQSAAWGVLIGGGILYLIAWLYWLIRREVGLGFGDVKLLAVIAGWLGYQSIFSVILIGSVAGSAASVALMITRKGGLRTAIPFGPFLAIGAFIHMIFGRSILELIRL